MHIWMCRTNAGTSRKFVLPALVLLFHPSVCRAVLPDNPTIATDTSDTQGRRCLLCSNKDRSFCAIYGALQDSNFLQQLVPRSVDDHWGGLNITDNTLNKTWRLHQSSVPAGDLLPAQYTPHVMLQCNVQVLLMSCLGIHADMDCAALLALLWGLDHTVVCILATNKKCLAIVKAHGPYCKL